ncbi:MAG: tetratricopeptide repeat protein [Fuerstiella sp.]|nr:tetratricopeptide repeat protein [Fuerstiella sp.]
MSEPHPMQKAAQEWYRKGTEALQKQNFDFAVESFGRAVSMKPDNVLYRQTRHGSLERMYEGNGSGARMSSVRLVSIRGRVKKSRMKKDWKAVDQAAEEGLFLNPWDAQLFADIGEAAVQREFQEVAEYAWKRAVKFDRTNIAYNDALGKVLMEGNKFLEARECFKRICDADPTNGAARSMMTQCDAQAVMYRGGYGDAESTRDVAAQPETTVNAYDEDRKARKAQQANADAPGESSEADMRHAIRKDPSNLNNYLRLAEYFREQRQLTKSLELYDQVLEKSPGKTEVLEFREDVELEILNDKLADARSLSRMHPDKTRLKEKAATLSASLIDREIEILVPRIERHPQDMKMKFDLADLFRRTKQFVKAIPLYQQASADIRLKEDSLVWLGECFVRSGQVALGIRQFDKALESLNAADKPDPFKLAHYWQGRIAEKTDRHTDADQHYTEILSVDYGYRDVQTRLQKLQGGGKELTFDDNDGADN